MADLVAELFAADSRVIEAKERLLAILAEYQGRLTGIRPPDPERKQTYEETIARFNTVRGGDLYFPYLGSGIGNGPLVELADGSVKYDFISGIGVHHFGHSSPRIVETALDAALRDTVMHGNLQQNREVLDFSETLLGAANKYGGRLDHCLVSTSGAMANENALKVIFQNKYPADRILAFSGCFAGRTLTTASITDKPAYRCGVPSSLSVDYVPFFDSQRPVESTRIACDHVGRHLDRYPGKHAGMIFELVQGEGGFFPGNREFFAAVMDILKERNTAVWIDEIQTFGRTSELYAFQHFGLDEYVDVVTVGKLSQACATLFTAEFKPAPGLLSQTFTGSASALAAGTVIVRTMLEEGFFGPNGKNQAVHGHFSDHLTKLSEKYPDLVSGPFGIGAMIAFTPFRGDVDKVKRFVHALFDAGVIAFVCGGAVQRVRFLVPVGTVTFDHIDEVAGFVERVLTDLADSH